MIGIAIVAQLQHQSAMLQPPLTAYRSNVRQVYELPHQSLGLSSSNIFSPASSGVVGQPTSLALPHDPHSHPLNEWLIVHISGLLLLATAAQCCLHLLMLLRPDVSSAQELPRWTEGLLSY